MGKEIAPEGAVGRRVAVQRKLAGLTQHQLATRAHVSKSLVAQVEIGALPASAAFTAAAARALRVDVEALTGEPYGHPLHDPQAEHAGIAALRIALDCDEDPDVEGFPLPAAELRTRLDRCQADREKARYAQMLAVLPELLEHAYLIIHAARAGQEAETAWALLNDAYELARTVSLRFGYHDLGALAARCGRDAAICAGDPLRVAVATHQHVGVQLRRGDYTVVLRAVDRAHGLIESESSPAADAVRVVLHLRQATAHARLGARDRADEHISEARRLVTGGVPAHPFYGVNANLENVDIAWVAVPVELSDGTTAIGRAEQVRLPSDAQPSRAGHHWIDVARAWTLHGDHAKALGALNEARRIAPQQTRYHSSVRETVYLLAEHDRRANDTLASFARWAGVSL
ncbi:MAG: helix-turn-helix domain-containing protein [Pseudonocardiaceae bacterium]